MHEQKVSPKQRTFITSAMAKVMFSSLSVALSVCLSVCLSVRFWFSWNFQGRWELIPGTIGNIFKMFHSTPWTQDLFFPLFRSNLCPLAPLQKNGWMDFHEIFRKRTDMTQEPIWNIFGTLWLTLWIMSRFVYFLDPCLFVILWKNRWTDFHEIFYETSGMTQEIIS